MNLRINAFYENNSVFDVDNNYRQKIGMAGISTMDIN